MLFKKKPQHWWAAMGQLIDEYQIPNINPLDHTYPAWPGSTRSLRLIKTTDDTLLVVTDGMRSTADGVGEFYLETDELIPELSGHWQTNIIYELGRYIPKDTALFGTRLKQHGTLSMSINISGAPDEWSHDDPNGNIGLFMRLTDQYASTVPLISVKLMRPAELKYAISGDDEARQKLLKLYEQQGRTALSSMGRQSVI